MTELACGIGRYLLEFHEHGRRCFSCRRAARINHDHYAILAELITNSIPTRVEVLGEGKSRVRVSAHARKLLELLSNDVLRVAEAQRAIGMDAGNFSKLLSSLASKRLIFPYEDTNRGTLRITELGLTYTSAGRSQAIGPKQLSILRAVRDLGGGGPVTYKQLSDHLDYGRQTLSSQVVNMRLKGWVTRDNGRSRHCDIALTPAGMALLEALDAKEATG